MYFYRCVHNDKYRRDKHWKTEKVAAPVLCEPVKRITFFSFHKEHIVRIEEVIENTNGDSHTYKEQEALGDKPCTRLYISAYGEHKRVKYEEYMTYKTAYVHKIKERKLCPSGEEYCHNCRGNADRIKEIINGLCGLKHMNSYQKHIDGAKVQGKVIFSPKARNKKYGGFEHFGKDDKSSDCEAEAFASCFAAFAVKQTQNDAGYKKKCYPSKVKRAEVRKSEAFFNTARGFPKVFHRHNISP